MVERHRDTDNLKSALRIAPDDLDSCLVQQPGLFYAVAEALSVATSQRDAMKLELEEAQAELDQQFRLKASDEDPKAKVREGDIESQIKLSPRIKQLQRRFLESRTRVDDLAALKEAYHQRSFMLRELVAVQLAHFQNLQVERGVASSRHQLGDTVRQKQEQLRRERRV